MLVEQEGEECSAGSELPGYPPPWRPLWGLLFPCASCISNAFVFDWVLIEVISCCPCPYLILDLKITTFLISFSADIFVLIGSQSLWNIYLEVWGLSQCKKLKDNKDKREGPFRVAGVIFLFLVGWRAWVCQGCWLVKRTADTGTQSRTSSLYSIYTRFTLHSKKKRFPKGLFGFLGSM